MTMISKALLPALCLIVGIGIGWGIPKSTIDFQSSNPSQDDVEFYKGLNVYMSVLEETDYGYLQDQFEKMESDEGQAKFASILLGTMRKDDPKIGVILDNLKSTVTKSRIQLSKAEQDNLFQKNTSCATLVQNIKDDLEKNSLAQESFSFIFYSPTLNTCIYSTELRTSSGQYSAGNYSSETSKKVYNANSRTLLNSYRVYSSKDIDDSAKSELSKNGRREYMKFILENSNFDADLLKEGSYNYL